MDALTAKIKPEIDKGHFEEYARKAEELADALRRLLVIDGIP